MAELDWDQIVKAERRKLYGYAYNQTRNPDTALDLVQDTLLRAYDKRHQFKEGNFGGWLMTIMRTNCINHFRRLKCRPPERLWDFAVSEGNSASGENTFITDDIMLSADRIKFSAEDEYLDTEISKDILEALQKITPVYKQTLELEFFEHMTPTEIAKYLNIPRGTVATRKFKGLRQMREILAA